MNHIQFLFGILCLIPLTAAAQTGYSDAGSRANAMGNASVTLQDVYSAQNNPSALAYVEDITAGLSTQIILVIIPLIKHKSVSATEENWRRMFRSVCNWIMLEQKQLKLEAVQHLLSISEFYINL